MDAVSADVQATAESIGTSEIADSAIAASAAGRAKVADSFFNAATVAAKFAADSFTNANLLQLIQDGAFAADTNSRALFADSFITNAKLAGGITADKLANGAGLAALIAAGLGASASYDKTTNGAQTLLASDPAARVVLIVVVVNETFADGDTSQTVFIIGETDTTNKFAASTVFSTGPAAAGDIFILAGSLTADKALLVTGTPAAGTGTGGIDVIVFALPAAA